jgi:hypothetical protein
MFFVVPDDEWPIEKHLFTFAIRDSMRNPILIGISFVPFEAGTICQQLAAHRASNLRRIYIFVKMILKFSLESK